MVHAPYGPMLLIWDKCCSLRLAQQGLHVTLSNTGGCRTGYLSAINVFGVKDGVHLSKEFCAALGVIYGLRASLLGSSSLGCI